MIFGINGFLGCRPFRRSGVETTGPSLDGEGPKKNGLKLVAQKISLTELKVVFGNWTGSKALEPNIPEGWRVYVRGSMVAAPWAREVQTIPGLVDPEDSSKLLEFILVPFSDVVLVAPSVEANVSSP